MHMYIKSIHWDITFPTVICDIEMPWTHFNDITFAIAMTVCERVFILRVKLIPNPVETSILMFSNWPRPINKAINISFCDYSEYSPCEMHMVQTISSHVWQNTATILCSWYGHTSSSPTAMVGNLVFFNYKISRGTLN